MTVMGRNMEKVTENLISKISMGNSAIFITPTVAGIDIKA